MNLLALKSVATVDTKGAVKAPTPPNEDKVPEMDPPRVARYVPPADYNIGTPDYGTASDAYKGWGA